MSAFAKETMEADAHAFSALLRHIKDIDEKENTVIAIQVENETGFLNTDREHSDVADTLFDSPVPELLIKRLNKNYASLHPTLLNSFQKNKAGNWKEVFTNMAEEVFTAWYTAKYVEFVAKSGKEVYPLPMLTNCWLDKGQTAGKYPTG
ncbi:MAG: hypothetical protein KBT48_07355, partial [Firmicutes bacterium]|nr:hypothetical protein [Bacillota bacterium]